MEREERLNVEGELRDEKDEIQGQGAGKVVTVMMVLAYYGYGLRKTDKQRLSILRGTAITSMQTFIFRTKWIRRLTP